MQYSSEYEWHTASLTRTYPCSTDAADDFKAMNTQVLGMSVDSQFSHLAWIQTPRNEGGVGDLKYPLVSDFKKVCAGNGQVLCMCLGDAAYFTVAHSKARRKASLLLGW